MKLPRVSVIIPTYNRGLCVTEAVDSVLGQTLRDFEVIVVDDGSTDDTQVRLAVYGDRIRVIRQVNAGVSAARNVGMAAARGEWIGFLDSDDTWMPEKLERQMADLERHPEAVGHAVDVALCGVGGRQLSLWEGRGIGEEFEKSPVRARPLEDVLGVAFYTQAVLLKREVVERVGGFKVGMQIHEDVEFLARVALTGAFVVNRYLGVKLRRVESEASSLSSIHQTRPVESHGNRCRLYEGLVADARLTRQELALMRRRLSGARFDLSEAYGRSGRRMEALHQRWRSVVDNPGVASVVRGVCGRSLLVALVRLPWWDSADRPRPLLRDSLDGSAPIP